MTLSRHLQTSGLLSRIAGMAPEHLKEVVIERGAAWYREHPEERDVIRRNLEAFGLDSSPSIVDAAVVNTILHYFEKLLPLAGDIASYAEFLNSRIDGKDAIAALKRSLASPRGACLASAHFGAVEFITPYLAARKLPMNVALKFTTEQLSAAARQQAIDMERSGLFSLINIIELGKPKTVAAMQMAAALRRREIVLSVFDEKTAYSKPVELFGRGVWGGAGLDRMISFANTPVDLFAAFMVREGTERYRLELHKINTGDNGPLDAIYRTLQTVVMQHLTQWYFLHEEIPFVGEVVSRQ